MSATRPRARLQQFGSRRSRRRLGGRHVLGPRPYARPHHLLRTRVAGLAGAGREHPLQRRPLLGKSALPGCRDHRSSSLRRGIRQGESGDAASRARLRVEQRRRAGRARPQARRLGLPRHRAAPAEPSHRRPARARSRRRGGRASLRRPGAHRRGRHRASAAGADRVHRRHTVPPLHADRLGRYV